MHREESPDLVVRKLEPRRMSPVGKHRVRGLDTDNGSSSGAPAVDPPDAADWPSLWDAEIDGPHAPNLVIRGRASSEHPDDPESFPAPVDPVKPLHRVILEDFRRMADALIQSLRAFKKAMGPRGPDRPMPA